MWNTKLQKIYNKIRVIIEKKGLGNVKIMFQLGETVLVNIKVGPQVGFQ